MKTIIGGITNALGDMILGTWKHLDEIPSTTARHLDNFNPQNRNSAYDAYERNIHGAYRCGHDGPGTHPKFQPVERCSHRAIADTHAGMRDKAAAMCPHKVEAVDDFEKLLGDPDLDALVIATPNFHHIDVLRPALETGKPILCEKPLYHAGRYA